MINDFKNEKLDVIVLAGQSNAEGNGHGKGRKYKPNKDVLEIYDVNRYKYDFDQRKILTLSIPYELDIRVSKEIEQSGEEAGNFAHTFATEYIKNGYLKKGRKLLIVMSAIGGCGFARNHWGKDEELVSRMNTMIDTVLNLNKENKIVGMLWHQGEHDAFENPELSDKTRENFYYEKLSSFIKDFRVKYGEDIPVITGDICKDTWYNEFKNQCNAIKKATLKVCKTLDKVAFVSSNGLLTNRQVGVSDDNIHFCRQSLIKFGKRYFNAYIKLNK